MLALLRIVPRPGKRDQILEILQSVTGPALAEPGCAACEIAAGAGDDSLLFIEEWKSEADLACHLRSKLYDRVLAAVEEAASAPRLLFVDLGTARGLDLVRELRTEDEVLP
jgi:quinol monooxygenase YgiN